MKKPFLLILIVFSAGVFANQTLINLPANSWYQAPNSKMRPVCDPSVTSYECQSVQMAWSGGAYDPDDQLMLIWGGGHGDSKDNSMYAFDVSTLSWRRETNSTGSYASQDPLPNGDPSSRHTYDGVAYITHAKRFFAEGGSQAGNGGTTKITWTYDVANKTWHNMHAAGTAPNNVFGYQFTSAYDPVSKNVFMLDVYSVQTYNFDANLWTGRMSLPQQVWGNQKACLDTKRRLIFNIAQIANTDTKYVLHVYDIATNKDVSANWKTTGDTTGALGSGSYVAVDYDSKADQLITWHGGNPYALNLTTKVWSPLGGSGGPASGISQGTWGRFRYVPADNVFILINGVDVNAFFYKNTVGPGVTSLESVASPFENAVVSVNPNPFRSRTTLQIQGASSPQVSIFSLAGRRVAALTLLNGRAEWDCHHLAPGVYTALFRAGKSVKNVKLFLVK